MTFFSEFIAVAKPDQALDVLEGVIKSKRHRTWQKTHEPIMLRYLELCVDLKKSYSAKEGLYHYKNICQLVSLVDSTGKPLISMYCRHYCSSCIILFGTLYGVTLLKWDQWRKLVLMLHLLVFGPFHAWYTVTASYAIWRLHEIYWLIILCTWLMWRVWCVAVHLWWELLWVVTVKHQPIRTMFLLAVIITALTEL